MRGGGGRRGMGGGGKRQAHCCPMNDCLRERGRQEGGGGCSDDGIKGVRETYLMMGSG